ncbi:hypothetical protein V6N11_060587 [Hibiscus sabdariffa]|uniref:Uncharacterized protein n=1 Tax=Hibiscus sabdariffa TaxID=183260 RepID=A0ABR2QQT0_9ROSI
MRILTWILSGLGTVEKVSAERKKVFEQKVVNLFLTRERKRRSSTLKSTIYGLMMMWFIRVSLRLLTLILAFLGFIVLRGRDTLVGKLCLWSWEYLGVQFQISWYIGGGGNDKTINLMNLQCRILLLLKIRHSHLVVLHCVDTVRLISRDEKEFAVDFSFCILLLRMVGENGKDFNGNYVNFRSLDVQTKLCSLLWSEATHNDFNTLVSFLVIQLVQLFLLQLLLLVDR